MKKLFIILFASLMLTGCVNAEKATSLLEAEGYENIEITGYNFLECSGDDFYHTGFTATKNGRVVEGTVCAGILFKGSTIRFK